MHPFRTLSALAAALAIPLAAGAADLRVAVSDGPVVPATLYVALFDSAEALTADKALAAQTLPMRDGQAQLVFVGLPPGRYVLKSFADENGNGKLDANLVGVPIERYGFSNDARGRMGPPTFDAAAVPLETADRSIALRLH
ncbi:DUF2141 domain-containing protein [Variovorax sp. LT1P1]|uniref:DUF2141 domain-containing protein n=1 Tax=Variovorax sp. LT1P1 TaxID=3443730 RepID=UPI003F47B69D